MIAFPRFWWLQSPHKKGLEGEKVMTMFKGIMLAAAILLVVPSAAIAADDPYSGKVAIITGSSSGLGEALTKIAAEKGMRLMLVDINLAPSTQLAEEIVNNGGEAFAIRVDLSKPSERPKIIEAAMDRYGRIDYLMNNAGYTYLATLEQMELHESRRIMEVNYWAYVDLANRVIPIMKEQGEGTIFNVASILGHRSGGPGLGHYAAAKHALIGMFETAAVELADYGIRVRVGSPGGIKTRIAWNSVGPLADERRHRADNWEDPMIVAADIFEKIQGDDVVFYPGSIGRMMEAQNEEN